MIKFDPFDYENSFYEYDLNITDDEVNQIFVLVKNSKALDCKTTFQELNVLNFPALKNLKKQITDILDKYNLFLSNNWAQFYNKGDSHGVHIHERSVLSGIIYLTSFFSKQFIEYVHEFKPNKLLLFPSTTPHEVKTLKKDEERLVISFNATKHGSE
jgi:hypothetical protein